MMVEAKEKNKISFMRKTVAPALAGFIASVLITLSFNTAAKHEWVENLSPSTEFAITVGMFYFIIAIGMGVGALVPAFGAKFLEVEDADELREQRSIYLYSIASFALWGVALAVFALAAPTGPISAHTSALFGGLVFALAAVFAWRSYRLSDELMQAVNKEAAVVANGLSMILLGGWGVLAHLGMVAGPQPIDIMTSFYVLGLVGTAAAAGRRGMLKLK